MRRLMLVSTDAIMLYHTNKSKNKNAQNAHVIEEDDDDGANNITTHHSSISNVDMNVSEIESSSSSVDIVDVFDNPVQKYVKHINSRLFVHG